MWRPACNAAHTVWVRVIFFDFRDLYKVKFKQWRNTGIWESHTCIQNLTRSGCLSYSIYPTRIENKDLDQCRRPLAITTSALTCSRSPLKPGAPGPLPLPSIYAGIKLHCSSLHPIRWTNCFLSLLNLMILMLLELRSVGEANAFTWNEKCFRHFLDSTDDSQVSPCPHTWNQHLIDSILSLAYSSALGVPCQLKQVYYAQVCSS